MTDELPLVFRLLKLGASLLLDDSHFNLGLKLSVADEMVENFRIHLDDDFGKGAESSATRLVGMRGPDPIPEESVATSRERPLSSLADRRAEKTLIMRLLQNETRRAVHLLTRPAAVMLPTMFFARLWADRLL